MLLNLLNNYYVLKELTCLDKYKKIKLKRKPKNARSVNIATTANYNNRDLIFTFKYHN